MADQPNTSVPQEDVSSTAASWIVAAILIAAVVIAAFYFLRGTNPIPAIPNTGESAPVQSAPIEAAPTPYPYDTGAGDGNI